MRFSRLSLERYGRFEDCELIFRRGLPDLHVIYGANEAGKTTSLAAVSDLLFGFPTRSPYNFLFDYSLLRVGGVLEDGDRSLTCRRKKGSAGTLLDDLDRVIDEGPLTAMLKGQTRETFALSCSLDQEALRSGGRAMVEAKNDLGRTLFTAGSGLTGVGDELKRLEDEADAIWAPTPSQRRTFYQAQKQLSDAQRVVREGALKPKAWSDARQAAERARALLEKARKARDEVQSDLRVTDRVRRVAPLVRGRDEYLQTLRSHHDTVDLGRQREDSTEILIKEADEAQREKAVAEQLQAEAAERRAKVAADPKVLEQAEEIDELMSGARAGEKAARDLVGLEVELAAAEALCRRLKQEAGPNADVVTPRGVAAILRDLSKVHGEIAAAASQIGESRNDLEDRQKRAQRRLTNNPVPPSFDSLLDAIEAAQALGADADARCESLGRKAKAALAAIAPLLARLAPWRGSIDDLLVLPVLGQSEIETARTILAEIEAEIRREVEQATRSADQAAEASLEIEQLATGAVVSLEEIDSARHERQKHWLSIRGYVLAGTALSSPQDAVGNFEASASLVDEKMELRFNLADASSRLSVLKQRKKAYELEADQAQNRAERARRRQADGLATWHKRLTSVGLAPLEPAQLLTWQTQRQAVEDAHAHYSGLKEELDEIVTRRDKCRAAVAQALGTADPEGHLSSLLAIAERQSTEFQHVIQERRLAGEQLDQVASETLTLDRRQQRVDEEAAANARSWQKSLREVGLTVDVVTCGAVLDLLDDLREAQSTEANLQRRVDGIRRDASSLSLRVSKIAVACGIDVGDTPARLSQLCERLLKARAASTLITSLQEEEHRRLGEAEEAAAKLKTTEEALAPVLAETRVLDRVGLSSAIDRSRAKRKLSEDLASIERRILEEGDGQAVDHLVAAVSSRDPEQLSAQVSALNDRLKELNDEVDEAAVAHGDARSAFAALNIGATSAVGAAADGEQARSELEVLAEHYILKRAQAVMLKWAIEKYRERHQDPMLLRAGELFSMLTVGSYSALRVDADQSTPRLLGLRADGRTMVDVGSMSEGTTDQLFLALRLAALEQSVAVGINLPFLADDLFVNFDDQRAEAGFRVLAEVAKSTQVLFFTHHPHLATIAKNVVGADVHSECALT